MQKLITASAAALLVGIGAFSVAHTDAQRATRTTQGEIIEQDGEVRIVEKEVKPRVRIASADKEDGRTVVWGPENVFPGIRQQPGTWQVITHDDVILLLNSATGETFHLDDNDDGMFWKPIPRPNMQRRALPELPRDESGRKPMSPERIEQRLKELRKQMKEARGENRQRLEREVEELERMGKEREPKGDRDADRERRTEELEDVIREINEKIGNLKERFEDSDSVREREEIEKAIRELKEEGDRLRNELKDMRR